MRLVTHDSTFHYDEVLASAILLKIYPDSEIVRTRSSELIKTGDIVYDVGREYNPSENRYDHHQNTFNETFSPKYNVKLSSAGLIFKHFHEKLFSLYGFTKESPFFDAIVDKIYHEFFLPADAIDNGYDNIFGEIKVRNVADVVRNYNICTKSNDESESLKIGAERFSKALKFVSEDLFNYLDYIFDNYIINYELVYKNIKNCDSDILYLETSVSTDLIYDVEDNLKKGLKFVIIKKEREYKIITFPEVRGKFSIKYPLKKEWRGLSGEELCKVSGIKDCVFVHATGFTGSNSTFEGAIEMCRKSLE